MAQPWKILDRVPTPEGILELRQRGDRDFLITIGPQVLMNSTAHRSEVALGQLACRDLRERVAPRVLVGGLGMAFTLRAVLDMLPPEGWVMVAELNPVVVQWCRGPLAPITGAAVDDPRVQVEIGNVVDLVHRASKAEPAEKFDAVVFDLYRGPHARTDPRADPLYGSRSIAAVWVALKPGGFFAVWGENYDAGFDQRLRAAGFVVSCQRPGRGGLRHAVFVAEKPAASLSSKRVDSRGRGC